MQYSTPRLSYFTPIVPIYKAQEEVSVIRRTTGTAEAENKAVVIKVDKTDNETKSGHFCRHAKTPKT